MTELINALGKIIAEQGIWVALILVGIAFFYYKLWPQYIANQDLQRKVTDDYRASTLQELKELKEDSRKDKQLMYEAFLKNVESNVRLNETISDVIGQLREMRTEIAMVKQDVRTVYILVGKGKRLIDPMEE
jgi:hypothetical protein